MVRWETSFKLKEIDRFYKSIQEPIVEWIGIAVDELDRLNRERQKK